MSYLNPTVELADGRRITILATRSSSGRSDGPVDECLYCVIGCRATPVWVKVASLRPVIAAGKVL